ncbi:hypothetical protein A2V82_03660 [candidate division KSB1 bacterium RBG_16_48_16]|nr:MAG: hypothetical protein A2V82_03660 [candidate division KSB1 bacterium RBG_16_48_16]
MPHVIKIQITSEPEMLRIVRAMVDEVCLLAGFTSMESSKVVLAVDEACSNVIKHAYRGKVGQLILITAGIFDDRLEIEIKDHGEKVDPQKIKSRKLSEIRPGGLGVHLMKTVMDEVKFVQGMESGNCLLMIKKIAKE